MNRVFWTQQAVRDLDSIADHYTDVAPEFVERIEEALLTAADFLLTVPAAGSPFGLLGVRKWAIARLPYVMLYQSSPSGIEIFRIHHSRQNWRNG